MKTSIFIVDRNDYFLSSIINAISKTQDYEIVGIVNDGIDCVKQLQGRSVDILVLDMILRSGTNQGAEIYCKSYHLYDFLFE